MKLLQKVIYKNIIGTITDITEQGEIYIVIPRIMNNKLQGYIRIQVTQDEIELL